MRTSVVCVDSHARLAKRRPAEARLRRFALGTVFLTGVRRSHQPPPPAGRMPRALPPPATPSTVRCGAAAFPRPSSPPSSHRNCVAARASHLTRRPARRSSTGAQSRSTTPDSAPTPPAAAAGAAAATAAAWSERASGAVAREQAPCRPRCRGEDPGRSGRRIFRADDSVGRRRARPPPDHVCLPPQARLEPCTNRRAFRPDPTSYRRWARVAVRIIIDLEVSV